MYYFLPCDVHNPDLNFAKEKKKTSVLSHFFRLHRVTAFPQTETVSLEIGISNLYNDRAALIAPLLWKIILNSIKRQRLIFPMFLPLSLQLLIRCLNLLQNNSARKEIKGC